MNNPSSPAFVTDDGEVFELPDLPEDLGRACALASEAAHQKFWGEQQEYEEVYFLDSLST